MPNPVQNISKESITEIKNKIEDTIQNGIAIRKALAEYSNSDAYDICLLYTSPSPRDGLLSRMPSSA